jgi:hypothetical protein
MGWSDGLRRAAAALWALGAGFAGFTAVLAAIHSELGFAALYALIGAALALLGTAVLRGSKAVEWVTLVLLGSQVVGVAGSAWELVAGHDDNAKARHLHGLGVNYRLALAVNLAYSLAASVVFVVALADLRHRAGTER